MNGRCDRSASDMQREGDDISVLVLQHPSGVLSLHLSVFDRRN